MKTSIALANVWGQAARVIAVCERWLASRDQNRTALKFNKVDQLKLTTLNVWAMRHRISVMEVLDILLPILRTQTRGLRHSALGVPVKVLTGSRAKAILEEHVRRRYPDKEHVQLWKETERDRQLEAERAEDMEGLTTKSQGIGGLLDYSSTKAYTDAFIASIRRGRNAYMSAAGDKSRRKRKYRGNPWV